MASSFKTKNLFIVVSLIIILNIQICIWTDTFSPACVDIRLIFLYIFFMNNFEHIFGNFVSLYHFYEKQIEKTFYCIHVGSDWFFNFCLTLFKQHPHLNRHNTFIESDKKSILWTLNFHLFAFSIFEMNLGKNFIVHSGFETKWKPRMA